MAESVSRLAGAVVGACMLGVLTPTAARTQPSAAVAPRRAARAIPRTPEGHPDMQGVWFHGTATPLERPPALGTKRTYTPEERAEAERQRAERMAAAARTARPGDVGGDNEAFVDDGYVMMANGQTSQLINPPDGRFPFTPEALKRAAFNSDNRDDYETMSPWDRCITRGPTLQLPASYNNGTRIVQAKGLFMIEGEMLHEARVVASDGRPHLPARVRTWLGDPVGRWEGDTFVIDSTNFHDRGWLSTYAASGRLRGVPHSDQLHLVERFTMTGPDSITYELTVEDPVFFTRPWTASVIMTRDPEYVIYEAACHEGNQAIELVLRGARFEEKKAPSPPSVPTPASTSAPAPAPASAR